MGTLVAIIDRSQKLRPHSKELYRHAAQLFEAFAPGERTWTPATVEAWRDSMVRGRKPQTVNRYLNGIRYASRRYEALGHGVDFARSIERLREPDRVKRKPLTREEAQALLGTCSAGSLVDLRDRALIVVGLKTGARASWLCDLSLSGMEGRRATAEAKGGRGHTVVLDDECLGALGAWLRAGVIGRGKVFRSIGRARMDGEQALGDGLSRQGVHAIVRNRGRAAKIRRPLHPHLFRHTYVTWSLDAGVPPHRVMAQSGHRSMAVLSGYVSDLQAESDPIGAHLGNLIENNGRGTLRPRKG